MLKKKLIAFYQKCKAIDIITYLYLIVTAVIILTAMERIDMPVIHLLFRLLVAVFIYYLVQYREKFHNTVLDYLNKLYPLLLISFFYSETIYLNHAYFGYFDQVLMNWDFRLFHCQPSIEFVKQVPNLWFNELMNLGYFSYFPLIFGVSFWIAKNRPKEFNLEFFCMICSFYIYYLIFIFFPSMGPQFYFQGTAGKIPESFFFSHLMKNIHFLAEGPTGAFPSSHVGITVMLLFISIKYSKKLFFTILPIALILILSTIYIKAHYLIDVLAGFATAPIFYYLSNKIYLYTFIGKSSLKEEFIFEEVKIKTKE